MKREDVPAELVNKGRNALGAHLRSLPPAGSYLPTLEERTRAVLAAVLPEFERMVREQAAREIEAAERELSETDPATVESSNRITAWCGGLLEGARIARGGE